MGNSPASGLRPFMGDRDGVNYFRFDDIQVGRTVSIRFRSGAKFMLPQNHKIWRMTYMTYMYDYAFRLTKITGRNTVNTIAPPSAPHGDDMLVVYFSDRQFRNYTVTLRRAGAGLFDPLIIKFDVAVWNQRLFALPITNVAANASGGVTETSFDMYCFGRTRILFVCEWKKKSRDEKPYTGAMAHYFATTENGDDVGLSVVVKRIRVLDDGYIDFVVDGPHRHPVNALLYMFEEVRRTRTWSPNYCPHCNVTSQHGKFLQSENEDSDMDNVVPKAPLHSRGKNGVGGLVANEGKVNGNNNGNVNIGNLFIGLKDKLDKLF